MDQKTQLAFRRIFRSINAEIDGISHETYKSSVKEIRKLAAELKDLFYAAGKANRQNLKALAKDLQQCNKERKEIRESLNELRSIQAAAKQLRSTGNQEEILASLHVQAGKIIPVEKSCILLFEHNSENIIPLPEIIDKTLRDKISGFLEEGIIDWIIDEKRAVVIEDFETVGGENQKEEEKNFVFIPLQFHGQDRGIFALYTPKPKHEFTSQDLELLTLLTEQGAIAIENYRISQQYRVSKKENKTK